MESLSTQRHLLTGRSSTSDILTQRLEAVRLRSSSSTGLQMTDLTVCVPAASYNLYNTNTRSIYIHKNLISGPIPVDDNELHDMLHAHTIVKCPQLEFGQEC